MIRRYFDVLDESVIDNIRNYLESNLDKPIWTSSSFWQEELIRSSSIISICNVNDKGIVDSVKNTIENILDVNFDELDFEFVCQLYLWSRMSYITWHDDKTYPYNGTIYLNKDWNMNDGGIFLWMDNQTQEIKGIEPLYNTMVVNSHSDNDPCNSHCVTSIVPDVLESRITIQWRAKNARRKKDKSGFDYQ